MKIRKSRNTIGSGLMGLGKALLVVAVIAATAAAPAAVVDISGDLGQALDDYVGAGNDARLVGDAKSMWYGTTSSADIDLNGYEFELNNGNGNATWYNGAITGPGTIKIVGRYDATWSPDIGFGGSTANSPDSVLISQGRVTLNKDAGVDALAGPIAVGDTGIGILFWSEDDQIDDNSGLTLAAGASLNLNGHSDTMGTLAITGEASIYLGSGNSVARFADSSSTSWTAEKQLVIREWNGSATGGGSEAVFFGNSEEGLGATQLDNIGFMDPAGFDAGLYHAEILPTGEVVPTGSAVEPVSPPYDLSESAIAARAEIYTSSGRADLSGSSTPLTDGTRIVFFGDSITWQNNYIGQLNSALASGAGTADMEITLINRGINGGGVIQVRDGSAGSGYPGDSPQESFDSLLVSDQADIAVVFIGVNDVWWRETSAADFEQALRDIAASADARDVKLVFATIAARNESPIGAGPDDPEIDQFSDIIRDVAFDTGAQLVDIRKVFVAWWRNNNYEIRLDGSYKVLKQNGFLTYDGVHPTGLGNGLIADHMAEGIIDALASETAFENWAAGKGLAGSDADFGADPDGDGVPNIIEFVLGGEPNPDHPDWNSRGRLPTGKVAGDDFVFTFTRMDEAAELNPVVEFGTSLDGAWTTAVDPGNAMIEVVDGSSAETIIVSIPRAGNSRMFVRLTVTGP